MADITFQQNDFSFSLSDGLDEDKIWRKNILPVLQNLRDNIERVLQCSFAEMNEPRCKHRGIVLSFKGIAVAV